MGFRHFERGTSQDLTFPVAHVIGVPTWYFVKVKAILVQTWTGHAVSMSLRCPDFTKSVRVPFTPPRKYSWYLFLLHDESSPGRQCGRKDAIENRTCDFPARSALPQPAAPARTPHGILLCDSTVMEVSQQGFFVGGAESLGSVTKALIN
jgi:hypothetical protein